MEHRHGGAIKVGAERVAVAGALALAAVKLAAGLWTGSIALLSAAADSLLDAVISTANLLSIRLAELPADRDHPYGHGKVESLAGLVQAAVIGAVGGWLAVEAGRRLWRGARPEHAEWAIAVMAASTVASWLIARHLRRVGDETGSVALRADSLHYATDVWTNGGILAALGLQWLTGLPVFDPLIAMGVAAVILGSAGRLLAHAVRELMDAALPEPEQRQIAQIIRRHRFVVGSHRLRTRRSGSQRQIDFSIVACRHLPLGEAHDLADHIEREIEGAIPGAHVVVHLEPCGPECPEPGGCVRPGREDLLAHKPPR